MRIVSQDGLISVPFEMTIIRAKGTFIKMSMVGYAGETVIAEYNTPEKAEKAMRLLHDTFLMHSFVNLTKGHICTCRFKTEEEALQDLQNKVESGEILGYEICKGV